MLQVRYEKDFEKFSRSLHSIEYLRMLLSSKFNVSELSLSKVTAVQILTLQNDKSPQNCFFTIWHLISTLPELRRFLQRTLYEDEAAYCVPWVSFKGLPSPTLWKSSLGHLQLLAIKIDAELAPRWEGLTCSSDHVLRYCIELFRGPSPQFCYILWTDSENPVFEISPEKSLLGLNPGMARAIRKFLASPTSNGRSRWGNFEHPGRNVQVLHLVERRDCQIHPILQQLEAPGHEAWQGKSGQSHVHWRMGRFSYC